MFVVVSGYPEQALSMTNANAKMLDPRKFSELRRMTRERQVSEDDNTGAVSEDDRNWVTKPNFL